MQGQEAGSDAITKSSPAPQGDVARQLRDLLDRKTIRLTKDVRWKLESGDTAAALSQLAITGWFSLLGGASTLGLAIVMGILTEVRGSGAWTNWLWCGGAVLFALMAFFETRHGARLRGITQVLRALDGTEEVRCASVE